MAHRTMIDEYPSRISDQPTIIPRKDPVWYRTDPSVEGPLSVEQLTGYDQDGYLLLEHLLSREEVERLLAELERVWAIHQSSREPEVIREPAGDAIRSIFRVHETNPIFNRLSRDPRILGAARQILGGDVYVHQSRINLKPGFTGKEFYWHSDFETWHVEDGMPRMRALSFSVLLDDNLPFNGSLMVMPGSHRDYVAAVGRTPKDHYKESLRRQAYGVPDQNSLTDLYQRYGLAMTTGAAGSVLMFDCNLMHGSASNITPLSRRNVFLVYNSIQNALVAPFSGEAPRPTFAAAREAQLIVL